MCYGVQYICIVLGLCLIFLILVVVENCVFIYYIYFDECGFGYLVFGLVKVSWQLVVVIVIFGIVIVNFYLVLIEVGFIGEKLILLIVDCLLELIDCGVNQVICQLGMFVFYFVQMIFLLCFLQDIFVCWLVLIIDQVLGVLYVGGVYINCLFVELLYGDMDEIGVEWQQQFGNWWQSDKFWLCQVLQLESEKQCDWFFW